MLYLSGIILSFFLSFVLITKNNKTHADYILFAWLCVTGFHLLTFYLFSTVQYMEHPDLIALGFPLPLAQGPFLYLYTRQQTSSLPFKTSQLLHFIPVILSYLLFLPFYLMPFEEKVDVFINSGKGYETYSMINLYAIYVSGIVYVSLSLYKLLKYRKNIVHQFSNTDKINFNWLLYLIIWMLAIWILVLFANNDQLVFGAAALFVMWLGYFGIKQVRVFSENTPMIEVDNVTSHDQEPGPGEKETYTTQTNPGELNENVNTLKYQKSSLSEQEAEIIHDKLNHLLVEQKPFKNPDLTLNELAKTLEVHPNHLSQVINSREKKNFYDLINQKRVEEFINLISKPLNQQYTLLGIAYDCGFNSKASFNRNFKKYTRLTPSDYLKMQP